MVVGICGDGIEQEHGSSSNLQEVGGPGSTRLDGNACVCLFPADRVVIWREMRDNSMRIKQDWAPHADMNANWMEDLAAIVIHNVMQLALRHFFLIKRRIFFTSRLQCKWDCRVLLWHHFEKCALHATALVAAIGKPCSWYEISCSI
jgi:hypothetical protein